MSAPTAQPDTDTDLAIDLEALIAAGPPACTSRALHGCSRIATHATQARVPCPDAPTLIFWCEARLQMHFQRLMADVVCHFCERPCWDCWQVRPI